ncbi:MAG: hypothetical protein WCR21_05675 [Bacteroidota bacterium]
MKQFYLIFFLLIALLTKAQGKNAKLTLLDGTVIEANITEALPFEITGVIKGKIVVYRADSLAGFYFEGNEYLSLKPEGSAHFEYSYKLKTLDEFELYGWREVFDKSTEGTVDQESTNIYKFIKRQKDDRFHVFEFSKEGVEQMQQLNCINIMKDMLGRYSSFESLLDMLNAYERDCGVEMRNK